MKVNVVYWILIGVAVVSLSATVYFMTRTSRILKEMNETIKAK